MRRLPISFIVARLSAGCRRVIFTVRACSPRTCSIPPSPPGSKSSFRRPTPAQAEAWPLIKAGRNVLIAAPTGSGKTLAAFLAAIDDLVRQGLDGGLKDETQVVYVSPLKALSNDIQRNLEAPLAGIRQKLARAGPARRRDPHVGAHRRHARRRARSAWRAGRRTSSSRRRSRSTSCWAPSPAARMLATTRTVIVDEIHAVAPNKRGSHLALSLERLAALCGDRLLRIGLSATQKPIEEVARFLVGAGANGADAPDCAIIDSGHRRDARSRARGAGFARSRR